MSLKAIKEAFSLARARKGFGDTEEEMLADDAAMKEVAALEKATADLTRLRIEDVVYLVRDSAKVLRETKDGESTWNHPDVKAWGDAAMLLTTIAKEAK